MCLFLLLLKFFFIPDVSIGQVITLDARNHGESPHAPSNTYEDLAEDTYHYFKQHNIEKAIVIGHSMGGLAMLTLALKYPSLVKKAVVVDISPFNDNPSVKDSMVKVFPAMENVQLPSEMNIEDGKIAADAQLKKTVTDEFMREFILMNLMKADGRLVNLLFFITLFT